MDGFYCKEMTSSCTATIGIVTGMNTKVDSLPKMAGNLTSLVIEMEHNCVNLRATLPFIRGVNSSLAYFPIQGILARLGRYEPPDRKWLLDAPGGRQVLPTL